MKCSKSVEIYAKSLRLSQKEAAALVQLQQIRPEERTTKDWEFIDRILVNLVEKSSSLQRSNRPSTSFMKSYQDLAVLETLPKSELVKLAQQIGIASYARSRAKTANLLRAEIANYLRRCEQLAIPSLM